MSVPINTTGSYEYKPLEVAMLGLTKLTDTDTQGNIIPIVAEIGGGMTAKVIVTDLTAGSIIIETAEVNVNSYYTTKETIIADGDYTLTIGDTDNYLRIKGDETLAGTDLIANLLLKKKIVEGGGGVVDTVDSADDLPTSPSEGDRVTINDASILAQGGCVIDVIYCNGKWVTVGSNVIYRDDGTTLDTTGNSSTWIQIGTIVIPREVVNKNVKAYGLLTFPSGFDGSRGIRIGNRVVYKIISSNGSFNTAIEFRLQGVVDENRFVTTVGSEVVATVTFTSTELQGTGNITLPIYLYSPTNETLTLTGLEVSV